MLEGKTLEDETLEDETPKTSHNTRVKKSRRSRAGQSGAD